MKWYEITVFNKQTGKISKEVVKYPSSVEYWKKVIQKDNVKSNLVLADFKFDNYSNQIILTDYTLITNELKVDISLLKDRNIIQTFKNTKLKK